MKMETKDSEVIGLKSIIVKYILHWRLFLIVFLASFIPAVAYLILYPRTYEIMARIQIMEEQDLGGASLGMSEAMGLMRSFGLGGMAKGAVNIEDEMSLLTSNALLSEMANDLGVNVAYRRPLSFYRLYDDNPLLLTADSVTNKRLKERVKFIVRNKGGVIHVKTKSKQFGKHNFTFTSLPALISPPSGNFTLDYAPGAANLKPQDMDITFFPLSWVAEEMEEDFLIEELSKTSNVIELSCTDYERNRGLNMLDRLVCLYNEETRSYKGKEDIKTMTYLNARIDTVTASLKSVEQEIAVYKNLNTLTDVEHDVSFYVEQMRDVQVKLIELESQSHLINIMDQFVKDPLNKYSLVPALLNQESEGNPLMLYNSVLVERARVIQNSNKDNPLAINLTSQADQLRESVFSSISNVRQATSLAIGEVKSKEKALFDRMESFPDKERDFVELKRRQEIFQGLYLILLQKREETALSIDLNRERAKVLDAAFVKKKPVGPRKLYAALGMIALTLLIPIIYIFCKEQSAVLLKEYRRVKDRT
ncbi:MAG: tyrosine protein kinase [Tannerellaceae bacterium]|jgi:uncharacterized protein involved in exopolysaccharide biosynthesis|nr:tyrosine protein kinase [Tannerellaceae bacterium]